MKNTKPTYMDELFKLQQNGNYNDLRHLIFPYLLSEKTKQIDSRIKFRAYYDPDFNEFIEDETPSIIVDKIFPTTFIINWNEQFPDCPSWDYFRNRNLESDIDLEKLYSDAVDNLRRKEVVIRPQKGTRFDISNIDYYMVSIDSNVLPSYNMSLLLLDEIWKNIYNKIGPHYLLPLYNECIYIVPVKSIDLGNIINFQETLKEITSDLFMTDFSNRILLFNGMLSDIF